MITFSSDALAALCPMHAVLSADGSITQVGPTLAKISPAELVGQSVFDAFCFQGPRVAATMPALLALSGRKLHLSLQTGNVPLPLKGTVLGGARGGALLSLGFGIGVATAVHQHDLTSTDFAPTDLAVDMLYLLEAKSVVMDAAWQLNSRLQDAMREAEERAYTDALTGLRNRRALEAMLERLHRAQAPFALLHVDLDRFKEVNDSLGHAAGDFVLEVLSGVMHSAIRRDDTLARVGGDEFVIVLENTITPKRLQSLAAALVARVAEPIVYAGRLCRVGCSIGISLSDGTVAPDRVMLEADIALYSAKREGRSQYRLFSESQATENTYRKQVAGEP